MEEFLIFMAIGFVAQLIDGALGMAYGLTTTTFLLNFGLPPVMASAVTHASECITTGFSALAHHQLGNVHPPLFRKLLLPGMIGAVIGVLILTHVTSAIIKPIMAVYLLAMGLIIIGKAFTLFPTKATVSHLIPLGFFGGFMDSIGGGGWGAIVTSTLIARGLNARTTIGSVIASEVFIAITNTIAFFLSNVLIGWKVVIALAIGGAIASPLGALICKFIPVKVLMFAVGFLIIGLSCRTLWMSYVQSH